MKLRGEILKVSVYGAVPCYIGYNRKKNEEDIRTAIERFVYNEIMENDWEKHLLLGFDTHANLLEIIYNRIDRQTINVFHAMKCRKAYYSLMEEYIRRLLWQE